MTATVLTWHEGEIVQEDAAVHFQRIEREKADAAERDASTARHVAALRRLSLVERRDYLANVERAEGSGAFYRAKASFTADWNKRKGTA